MKSKRLLAALLCVMMMLTIMPVLNVAAATTVTDAQLGLDSATTYTEWNIAANGATLPADGHITGVPAADMVDGIGMGYTEEGMRVVADATATFKDVAVTFDKSPVDNGTAIIFRAKAEGTETIALRNAGEVYIDIKNAVYGGRHTLTGHTIYNDVVFGTNEWTTYLVTQSPLGTGYYLFAKKDGATDWTWCGKFLDHNQGNATQMKFSFDYNKDTTTGVVVSSIKVVDGVTASAVPDPDYTTQADLIPSDWTATMDLDLTGTDFTWPSDALIQPGFTITDNDGDPNAYQLGTVTRTADGLNICETSSAFNNITMTTKDGASPVSATRLLKYTVKRTNGGMRFFNGFTGGSAAFNLCWGKEGTVGTGWVDYICKLSEDGTAAELYYDLRDGAGYRLFASSSSGGQGTATNMVWSMGYNGGSGSEQILSKMEVYEYVEPPVTLADLVPAAWGEASHTFDFKNASFDWDAAGYDGFTLTTTTHTNGSIDYTAEGAKICQDTTQRFSDFVINLESSNYPLSADRSVYFRAKVVDGQINVGLGNPVFPPDTWYNIGETSDWMNYLFKVDDTGTGIEIWGAADGEGYTLLSTSPGTGKKGAAQIYFSCGYNGLNNSSEAWISDIALYTNPSAGLQEGSNKKTEAEIMPEGWEAWVDLEFNSSNFALTEAQSAKISIGGISATVPTDGSCYAVYTDGGIHAYANKTTQFMNVNFNMVDGSDSVSANRIIKFRGRVNDGTLGETKKTSSIQVRADGSLGRIYQNIWPTRLELRGSDGAVDQYTAFLPGSNWATYIIKLNDAGTKYQLWAKMDADAKYTLIGEDDNYSTHNPAGQFQLSCGYNSGGTEAWISDFEVWQEPQTECDFSDIVGTDPYVLEHISLTSAEEMNKYRFAGAYDSPRKTTHKVTGEEMENEKAFEFSENGLTFLDPNTADADAANAIATRDTSSVGGTKVLKFTAKMEEGGDLKLRIGATASTRAYVDMTPTMVQVYGASTSFIGRDLNGVVYAPGTETRTYMIASAGTGYAMYVQTDATNDKWMKLAETADWKASGSNMQYVTTKEKTVTLKDIVVYETAAMAPVTLLDAYTSTYLTDGSTLTDNWKYMVRAIVNNDAEGKLIVAYYDADGKMVSADLETISATVKEEELEFNGAYGNDDIKTIKVFFWDNFDDMNSLRDLTTITARS